MAALDVTVPEPPDELTLYPPLLIVPDKPVRYLRFSGGDERDSEAEVAPLSEIYPQVTSRVAPVVEAVPAGTSRLTAIARFVAPDAGEAAPPVFSAALLSASGKKMALGLEVLETAKGDRLSTAGKDGPGDLDTGLHATRVDTLVAGITLPDIAPGAYRLVMTAEDPASGARSEAVRRITITP